MRHHSHCKILIVGLACAALSLTATAQESASTPTKLFGEAAENAQSMARFTRFVGEPPHKVLVESRPMAGNLATTFMAWCNRSSSRSAASGLSRAM